MSQETWSIGHYRLVYGCITGLTWLLQPTISWCESKRQSETHLQQRLRLVPRYPSLNGPPGRLFRDFSRIYRHLVGDRRVLTSVAAKVTPKNGTGSQLAMKLACQPMVLNAPELTRRNAERESRILHTFAVSTYIALLPVYMYPSYSK